MPTPTDATGPSLRRLETALKARSNSGRISELLSNCQDGNVGISVCGGVVGRPCVGLVSSQPCARGRGGKPHALGVRPVDGVARCALGRRGRCSARVPRPKWIGSGPRGDTGGIPAFGCDPKAMATRVASGCTGGVGRMGGRSWDDGRALARGTRVQRVACADAWGMGVAWKRDGRVA